MGVCWEVRERERERAYDIRLSEPKTFFVECDAMAG
jgi:hypothetical protein